MTTDKFTDCEPIFVVGAGRSGTTLLQLILNAHPRLAVMGELHYFDQVLQIKKFIPTLEAADSLDQFLSFVKRIEGYQYLPKMDDVLQRVSVRLRQSDKPTYEKFYRYVLEEHAILEGAHRFGEKTPENIEYLDDLLRIFPKAKIIHIVRDPRAVAASTVKMPGASRGVLIHAMAWRYEMLFGRECRNSNASYMETRYEQLVSNPRAELRRICDFIEEEYVEEMLQFHTTAPRYIKNEPWKQGTTRPIKTEHTEKWKSELTNAEVLLIEIITGKLLNELGYGKQHTRLSSKLVLVTTVVRELAKYGIHRLRKLHARAASPLIYSEKRRLYSKALHTMLDRKSRRSRST